MTDTRAKEVLIIGMMEAFPSGTVSESTPGVYAGLVAEESLEAVRVACAEFASGTLVREWRGLPQGPEFAQRVRLIESAIAVRDGHEPSQPNLVAYRMGAELPVGMVPLGPISADFGNGRIDMRRLSHADKEFVMKHHRLPPADTKRLVVTPKLQRA